MPKSFSFLDAVLLFASWAGVFFFSWCFFGIYNILFFGGLTYTPRILSGALVGLSALAIIIRAHEARWRNLHSIISESYILNFFLLASFITLSSLTARTPNSLSFALTFVFCLLVVIVAIYMWSQYRGLPWLYDLIKRKSRSINI